MCGIAAILLANEKENVNQLLFDALTILQHRGQDAAGIVTCQNNRFNLRKGNGYVKDVFRTEDMMALVGHMGLGHVRYPTAGNNSSCAEAQPFYTNFPYGICLAHNGNIVNTDQLRELVADEFRHVNTDSDSELILNIFAEELRRRRRSHLEPEDIFESVGTLIRRCDGGFAIVVLINGKGILAFRDPYGIRPLAFGCCERESGTDYVVSSESAAIDTLGFKFSRDIGPGEAIFITVDGKFFSHNCVSSPKLYPCLFEYVYFARPDSVIDGVSVYEARLFMGEKLGHKIAKLYPEHDIDVVMPIPDTSRTAALQLAYTMNIKYREGFIKNRYIARTFIMPEQETRKKSVKLKLNTIKSEFTGRNVLLVDDSIVRGTTSAELVVMAREAGAKKVYFASAAPPVRYPNVYGIDIPTKTELVAYGRNEQEVAEILGADWVVYQDLEDLEEAIRLANPQLNVEGFEASCFNGVYVSEKVTDEYLEKLQLGRGASSHKVPSLKNPLRHSVSCDQVSNIRGMSKVTNGIQTPEKSMLQTTSLNGEMEHSNATTPLCETLQNLNEGLPASNQSLYIGFP